MQVPLRKSIATKLFGLICIILLATLTANAWQFGSMFYSHLMGQLREKTTRSSKNIANNTATILEAIAGQVSVFTTGISVIERKNYEGYIANFVNSNRDFIYFGLLEKQGTSTKIISQYNTKNRLDNRFQGKSSKKSIAGMKAVALKKVARLKDDGRIKIINISPETKLPVFMLAIPFKMAQDGSLLWATLILWQTKLFSAMPINRKSLSYVFDSELNIISASKERMLYKRKMPRLPPGLQGAITRGLPFSFNEFVDQNGNVRLASFARVQNFKLLVYSESDGSSAYLAIEKIIVRTALWGAALLLIAVFFSYFASSGLTGNLKTLTDATMRIASGNFKLSVPIKSKDEVGLLGHAVNHLSWQIGELLEHKLENARLESELATARIVQDTFFPDSEIKTKEMSISACFEPASECGGDWWGHYDLGNGKNLVFIADATGHGVPAALITAMVYAASFVRPVDPKSPVSEDVDPADIVKRLNEMMYSAGKGKLTMTFFVGLFDFQIGTMRYANAGHNFPVGLPEKKDDDRLSKSSLKKGRRRFVLNSGGTPLGSDPNSVYKTVDVAVRGGDKFVFYTDGIFECANRVGQIWGQMPFYKTIDRVIDKSGKEIRNTLLKTSEHFRAGVPPDDDITLVIIEISKQLSSNSGPPAGDKKPVEADDGSKAKNSVRIKLDSVG